MALKKVKKMKEECCITCDHLMECSDVAAAKCRNYEPAKLDKTVISARYLEILQRVNAVLGELKQAEIEMKIAEKVGLLQPKTVEETAPISKRNKKIVALVKKGWTIKDIAKELELKLATVQKEIEYLINIGVLREKGRKVVVIPV